MARRTPAGTLAAPPSRRGRLLGGSALGVVLLVAAAANAQTLPAVPSAGNIAVATGGAQPVITAPDANTLDVQLNATRTVINWDSFHVSAADAVTFHFGQTSDIVLNKSPTTVKVDAGGQVAGKVGSATGGNIWFYSPGGVVIAPGAVMTAGNFVFARGDAIVDLDFVDAASPLSVLRSASDALIQIDTIGSATSASISAAGDLVLSAASGDLTATTALAAKSASVTATAGSVSIGEVTASGGTATVTASGGSATVGSLNGSAGATATASTDAAVTSANASGANADITITGSVSASLGGGTAGRDILVSAPTASLGSANAGRDVLVTASTGSASVTGAVTAGDDIEVTATTGSVAASAGSLTSTGAGNQADAHVLVKSTGGSVNVGSATTQGTGSAAGDVTIQAATSAALGSGGSTGDLKVTGVSASLGSGGAAGDVLVTASTGPASVTGAVTAGNDIEVTATTGSVAASAGSLTSTGAGAKSGAHVLAQSTGGAVDVGSAATQGTGNKAGDITITAATTAALGSGNSTRDITVSGPAASLGSASAKRTVLVTATTGLASVTGAVTAGDDIEVTATTGSVSAAAASLTSTGAAAVSDAHVLVTSASGSATVGSAATQGSGPAAGDITVQGATTASLGSGSSARDLKVVGPTASLGSGDAARSVFVTATSGSASVTGAVSAGDDVEVTSDTGSVAAGSGSLTSTGAGAVSDAHVLAKSNSGAVTVGSATTQGTGGAAGDVTIQAATTASLGSGASAQDIKVVAPTASLGSGSAARDIFVTATTGSASVTGSVSAGDDVEVTATSGSVTANGGSLTSTGAGAVSDAHVLARSTGGAVSVGSATTQGAGAAAGDVVIDGATTASLGSGHATHDVKVSGPSASLGSATASGDVFVTATTGSASVTGSVSAGDDVEVTATTGSVAASGSLTSTGVGAADDAHVLVKSTGGAVSLGSATTQGAGAAAGDIVVDGATTATVSGAVSASQDVQLFAGGAVSASGSSLTAGRDIAVRSDTANISLGGAHAGDDIAVRALSGAITATGDVEAGQTHASGDPDVSGAADSLLGSAMAGHDLDLKAQTIAIAGNVAAGRAPDNGETLGAAQVASDVTVSATNPDPSAGVAALALATGSGKAVTAHQDINLKVDNAGGASIQAGDVSAGRDVAVYAAAGNITLGSALAGDDVVLRAPSGAIAVSGDVAAGRDSPGMTPTDSPGAADDLNAALPFTDFDGNPGTVFKVVGFDVNIVSQAVRIGGSTIAGRQPSTDAPDVAGPVDATTSDVRIETRVSATPVLNLSPDIQLGTVIATRDLQIDSAKAVTTGDLMAGRDVAVLGRGGETPGAAAGDHSGAGVTLASAHAGDDALAFSVYGRTHVLGGVTAGAPFQRLVPTNDRVIDGATEAADQLAIYLHYFDLDDASSPYVLPGGVIHLYGQGITVGGALVAQGIASDIRLRSTLDIAVTGATTAGHLAIFQTDALGGGAVKVGAVTAGSDVMLDGSGAEATGTLTSTGGDVAVRGRDGGAVKLAGLSAADDVVVRTSGQITIGGAVSAGGGADSNGAGDALLASDGVVTLEGQSFDLTGHNVDIVGGSVTATGSLTATGTRADVRVQSPGAISLAGAAAGRDVLVDGATTVSTGMLSAGRDVGVRSTGDGASVTVGGAAAGDDVVIRAKGAIGVTGPLSAGSGSDSNETDQAGDLMFGVAKSNFSGDLDLVGKSIDVRTTAGSITVTGDSSAATDARFQTDSAGGGAVKVAAATAGRDVLLDGASAEATGTLTSTGGDVAVRARGGGAIKLADVSAGDDVVLRTIGAITLTGAVSAGGAADTSGLGDTLRATEGAVTLEGQTYDLTGHNVDVVGGSVTASGTLSASGARADVRVQSSGAISLADATAGRDVLVDGASTVATGMLSAGRDVGARSTGDGASVTVGGASAGDDVVIRAKGSIAVTGPLASGGGADSNETDQAGDLMFGAAKSNLAGDLDLVGRSIDVRSSGGSIAVTGAATAATDARFQTAGGTGGSVKVAAVTAGRDVLLDGGAGSDANGAEATGALTSTAGDVAVRARDGKAIKLAGVSAGDDVVLRATGAVTLGGAATAGGAADSAGLGDVLVTTEGAVTLEGHAYDLTGQNIDILGGSVSATGDLAASGTRADVRVRSLGAIALAKATAGRDVLVDGASTVSTGVLTAGRDVGVRSTGDGAAVTVGGATAGDDVVLRAKGAISVTGPVNAGGGADSSEADQAGDLMFGAAKSRLAGDLDLVGGMIDVRSSAGSITVTGDAIASADARFQTDSNGGGAVKVGTVIAGRDILIDGSAAAGTNGAESTGALTASNGDVAVRARNGSGIRLAGVTAGDDAVLRSTGAVMATGIVSTLGRTSTFGLGDRLVTSVESGPLSVGGMSFDLNNSDIDVVGGGPVNLFMSRAMGSTRIKAGAVAIDGATVGIDILIDSETSLVVGDLSAAGDIALRSRSGSLTVGSLDAGDDIVLRGALGVTARSLKARGADHFGVGDQLALSDPIALGQRFDLAGGAVDVKAGSGPIRLGSAQSSSDVRLQAVGGEVSVDGPVTAGRDILVDGGSVTAAGSLTAAGDVALNGRSGGVSVASISAGDDIVVRAAGDVTASGDLKSGQGAAVDGVGDQLAAASGSTTLFGAPSGADGGVIDLRGATIRLSGALTASGDNAHLRLQSTGSTTLGDASLTGDIAIDAGSDIVAGALKAGRDIALRSARGGLTIRSAAAGDDVVLRAAKAISVIGAVSAGGGSDAVGPGDSLFALDRTALGGDLDLVGQTVDIKSAGGDVSASGMAASGDVRIQSAGGAIATGGVQAGRDVLLDGGAVKAGDLQAGGDIALRASVGGIVLHSAKAGDDLVLRAAGDIAADGALAAGGGADTVGLGDRLFTIDPTVLGGAFDLVGRHIDLKSTSGAVATQGALNAADDIRLTAAGVVTATGTLDAGRDVLLDGASVRAAVVRAIRDLAVRGRTGSLTLGSLSAGDDVVLRAAQDIAVTGTVTAQGGADADGAGDRLFATDRTALAGDFDLAGANIDIRGHGAVTLGGAAAAGRDVRVQTVGDGGVVLAEASAGGDVLADAHDVRATGLLTAGHDVALRGRAGGVSLAAVTAGDDIAIRAAGAVKVSGALASGSGANATGAADRLISTGEGGAISRLKDPLASTASVEAFALNGGDIDIKGADAVSLGGDVTASGAASGVHVQAAGKISLAGVTAGDGVFVRGADLQLDGAWRAMTARIEVTAAGGLALGEGVSAPSNGLALSSAQLGRIEAPTLQIFVGDTSGAMRGGALSIGALNVDTSKIRTSLELYAGGATDVAITGALAPSSGAANTTRLRIGAPDAGVGDWTPKSIRVIANNGGSIGSATSTGGRTFTDVRAFDAVELNARGDILLGYQDFIDRLSTTPAANVAGVVKSLIAPQTASGSRILLAAGSLTLRADGKVAQQDTSGLLGSTPTGLYLMGSAAGGVQLLLGRTSASSATGLPEYIELSGALTSGGTIMTGESVALAGGIAFDKGVTPGPYYRLNTCAILQQGSCMSSNGHPSITIPPDQLTGLTLEDHTATAGAADPTVASATNEEVWKDPN